MEFTEDQPLESKIYKRIQSREFGEENNSEERKKKNANLIYQ